MYQTKEIRTSDDFFTAIDNGYNIYVNTSGKLVAYSSALSSEKVRESISVNPVFIRESFNRFFETTLHDLLRTQYADALHKFFQRYLESHTHFTLEASNALKREMRTLITAIKTEQITALYKMIPSQGFSIDDTEEFFREISKIPYYILLRIMGIPHLQKDFQQYLPPIGKITVGECIKVIEYFAQGFQTSESMDTPPMSVEGKWAMQGYNTYSAQKKSQKNEIEDTESTYTPLEHTYEEPMVHQEENIPSSHEEVVHGSDTQDYIAEEPSPYIHADVPQEYHEVPSMEEVPTEIDTVNGAETVSPEHQEYSENEYVVPSSTEGDEGIYHEEAQPELLLTDEHMYADEHAQPYQDISPHEIEPDVLHTEDIISPADEHEQVVHTEEVLSETNLAPEEGEAHIASYSDMSEEPQEEHSEEMELPYVDNHLFVEEQEGDLLHDGVQSLDIPTHYDDTLESDNDSIDEPSQETHSVIFSYDEFITHIASLESFVVNHASDFPEVNELFMNEMYTLLAFIAQYHKYNITRQQSKFELLQHATAVCLRYEEEKEHLPYARMLVLLTLALQSIGELHNKAPLNNDFLQLIYTLSENTATVEQYQALNVSEYEQMLVYASLLSQITPTVDIEQFLLHANTISAISIIKELQEHIYSAHFFHDVASLPFDDIQHVEEYYSAYYYQMLLFQYGEEFRPYIPADEYNAHVLFAMISIVEHIHSYVFTDEQQMEHCGKGILSVLVETYSIYVNDTSRSFIELFKEVANRFRE